MYATCITALFTLLMKSFKMNKNLDFPVCQHFSLFFNVILRISGLDLGGRYIGRTAEYTVKCLDEGKNIGTTAGTQKTIEELPLQLLERIIWHDY